MSRHKVGVSGPDSSKGQPQPEQRGLSYQCLADVEPMWFCGICKAGRYQMAKNMLIWPVFKATGCVTFNLVPKDF